MDVDEIKTNGVPNYSNLGTKNLNISVEPKVPCAKNFVELEKEFKQFKLLVKKDEMDAAKESGSVAFLVSKRWITQYKQFLLMDEQENQIQEKDKIDEDHFENNHPGPISNFEDLADADQQGLNLYGTDSMKGFEKEYADFYLKPDAKELTDYLIVHQELWNFLLSRYGGDSIKRYYIKKSNSYYSSSA